MEYGNSGKILSMLTAGRVYLLMLVSYSNIMNMEINAGKVIFPVRFEFVINDVTMVSVMGTVRFIHF